MQSDRSFSIESSSSPNFQGFRGRERGRKESRLAAAPRPRYPLHSMTPQTTTSDLRKLSAAELEQLGQDSLRDHILAQAVVAHQKHGPLTADKLDALLNDPDCLRHPVRLVFEFGEMAMHQFAQPDVDWRNIEHDGRVLYVRPLLRDRPDLLPLAVAYMIPLINYGDIISDEHCLRYGATLLGLMEAEYYQQLCALADFLGAETLQPAPAMPACSS